MSEPVIHPIPRLLGFLPPAVLIVGSAVLAGLGASIIYRAL